MGVILGLRCQLTGTPVPNPPSTQGHQHTRTGLTEVGLCNRDACPGPCLSPCSLSITGCGQRIKDGDTGRLTKDARPVAEERAPDGGRHAALDLVDPVVELQALGGEAGRPVLGLEDGPVAGHQRQLGRHLRGAHLVLHPPPSMRDHWQGLSQWPPHRPRSCALVGLVHKPALRCRPAYVYPQDPPSAACVAQQPCDHARQGQLKL